MIEGYFKENVDSILRDSADSMEGYIAREETMENFFNQFLRVKRKLRPNTGKTSGYKAFVLTQV